MMTKALAAGCIAIIGLVVTAHAADPDALAERFRRGGHVLMLRHAHAPGSGDPPHFQLGDCTTQRNLNARGRDQARRIGRWLRSRGIHRARVYSSQWCRCLETADLLELGPVLALPALNSFYERPADREPNLEALRDFLARQPADGEPLVLVTHYVTIAGLTGVAVSSAEGVLLELTGGGEYAVQGRWRWF